MRVNTLLRNDSNDEEWVYNARVTCSRTTSSTWTATATALHQHHLHNFNNNNNHSPSALPPRQHSISITSTTTTLYQHHLNTNTLPAPPPQHQHSTSTTSTPTLYQYRLHNNNTLPAPPQHQHSTSTTSTTTTLYQHHLNTSTTSTTTTFYPWSKKTLITCHWSKGSNFIHSLSSHNQKESKNHNLNHWNVKDWCQEKETEGTRQKLLHQITSVRVRVKFFPPYFIVPCSKFRLPYLGKAQQPQEQCYLFLSVCAVFLCVLSMARPPAFGILNGHTDVDACSCTRRLYGHCNVCACVCVCVCLCRCVLFVLLSVSSLVFESRDKALLGNGSLCFLRFLYFFMQVTLCSNCMQCPSFCNKKIKNKKREKRNRHLIVMNSHTHSLSHTHTHTQNNRKKKKETESEQREKGMLRGVLLPWESLPWWPSSLAMSCWEAAQWCRRTPQTACHSRRTWSRRCFLCLQLWTEQHDSQDSCGQNMTVKTTVDRTT